MTMSFPLARPQLVQGLKVGDKVRFGVRETDSGLVIERLEKNGGAQMIRRVIEWSVNNRFLVLLATLFATAWGVWAVMNTPIDALPDLSDVQVIIRTTFPGTGAADRGKPGDLSAGHHDDVGARREDGARLFVLRRLLRLCAVRGRHRSVLGALAGARISQPGTGQAAGRRQTVARPGRHRRGLDLRIRAGGSHRPARSRRSYAPCRTGFSNIELKSLPNVAEVATIGGMVKQYQVVLDPVKLASFGMTHRQVIAAIRNANQETGGGVLELSEAEYMVRASGYLKTLADFRAIPLKAGAGRRTGDAGRGGAYPDSARKCAAASPNWTGEGEVVGGVVILRSGKNARTTIAAVKARLAELKKSLPPGVEIVPTYDRSQLIDARWRTSATS